MFHTYIFDDDEENYVIINLSGDYRIFGGERAWELQQLRLSRGKSEWRAQKWFPSLSAAVREAAHHEIRTVPVEGVVDALEAVERITARFDALIDNPSREIANRAQRKLQAVS